MNEGTLNPNNMKKLYTILISMLLCGWVQAQIDSVQQIPATVPYTCDFSNQSENAHWILSRYPTTPYIYFLNHFVIGTGTSVTGLADDYALYVSHDENGNYSAMAESCHLFAERVIDFGSDGGIYDLELDWKASGTTPNFYQSGGLKVFLRDTSDMMPEGAPAYANEHLDYALYDNSWRHGHVNLGYVSGVKTLQFYTWGYNASQSLQVPAAVDNISIYPTVCVAPFFTISFGTSAVTFQWQGSPTDTFLVVYRPESGTYSDNVYDTVTGSSYAVTGMMPNTAYVAWMARICNGQASALSEPNHFVTPCMTYPTPFVETFTTDANCWSWDNNFFTYNQSGYIYTSAYSQYNPILAVSPVIDASGLQHPYLRFSHYQPEFQGNRKSVAVYYRDDEQDSWHKLGTYGTPTSNWVTDSLPLPSNSPTLQIAFEGVGSAYNTRAQFDNISVYDGPSCPVVSEVVSAGTDANGDVLLSWIGLPGYSYDVRYKKASDTAWTLYGGVITEQATLSGLESLTSYIVEVATLCDTTEAYYIQGTFTTPLLPVNLPYTTDFSPTSDRKWALDNSTCASYWMMGSPGTGNWNNALFVTQDGVTAGYSSNSYSTVCAYKTFNMDEGPSVYLEFDVQVGGESTNNYLKVFWVPDSLEFPGSVSTPQYISLTYTDGALDFADYVGQTGNTTYNNKLNLTNGNILHVNMELPNVNPSGAAKLVFCWRNSISTGVQPGAIISNVHLWQPSCYTVYDLNVPTTFLDTALVEWGSYSSTASYLLQYKPQTMAWTDPGVVSMVVAGTDTVLTGLLSQTPYDLRVAMLCEADTAEWQSISFMSGCDVVNVTDAAPFLETFSVDPECWKKSINPWHEWFYVVSGKFTHTHVYPGADSCALVTPVFDISGLTRPYLSLDHYQSASVAADHLGIYYRTSALDDWHPWALFTQTIASAHKDSLPLPQQSGLIQLAFFSFNVPPGGSSVLIDNVALFSGPECPPVYYVEADGVTADSATITWLGFSENGYVIRYRHLPDTTWIFYDTTYETYYIFDNLQDSKNYQVQVSSVCSGSAYKSVIFSTPLGIEEIPYYTDFSPLEDRGWKLNNGSCNNYWMIGQVNATADAEYALFITNDGSTPGYGGNWSWSTVSAEKLFRIGTNPEITIDFDIKIGGENYLDYLKLFFAPESAEYEPMFTHGTNPGYMWYHWPNGYSYDYNFIDYKPFTSYQEYPHLFNLTNGNVVHVSATMANPNQSPDSNSTAKVVFVWTNDSNGGAQPGAVIYNVFVHTNNCDPVDNLAVTELHPTSATVAWTAGNVETSWNIDYKVGSDATWISNAVNSTTHTLTGLLPETEYTVRVQADCGDGETSTYKMLTFVTPSCETIDQCEYTLILTDTWGDGWSGGRMYVFQNGVKIMDTAAISHPVQHVMSYDTVSLSLCHGADIRLVWDNGSMFNECGIIFQSPDGATLYQINQLFYAYPDTTLYAFTAECPVIEPVVVTDSVSQIGQSQATMYGHIADPGNRPIVNQGFEWRMSGSTVYQSANLTASPMVFTASGLQHSTEYVFRAFAATDTAVYYGAEITFTTEQGPCPAPTDLHVIDSADYSIAIAWTETGDAEQWRVLYRASNGQMSSDIAYAPSYLITGLQPGTEYQIQVQSVCGLQSSDWTPAVTASTTTGLHDFDRSFVVYPNPAKNVVCVEYLVNNNLFSGEIQVCDVYGKTVVGASHYSSLQIARIDVSGLAAGVYFVRVTTEEGVVTKAFVKK